MYRLAMIRDTAADDSSKIMPLGRTRLHSKPFPFPGNGGGGGGASG